MTVNTTAGEYHDLRHTVPSGHGFSWDSVDDGHECPGCGEFRMDWLEWAADDSHVECASCGRQYIPGSEE